MIKMIPVDDIPETRPRHDLCGFIEEFVDSKNLAVKVVFNGYKSAMTCYKSLWVAAKKSGYRIKVVIRGDDVYLRKL